MNPKGFLLFFGDYDAFANPAKCEIKHTAYVAVHNIAMNAASKGRIGQAIPESANVFTLLT